MIPEQFDRPKFMETLFDATIKALLSRIESGEASPADLNVARQMLKDNGISAIPKNPNVANLADQLDVALDEGPAPFRLAS